MMQRGYQLRSLFFSISTLLVLGGASAQEDMATTFELPQNPRAWLNGQPISVQAMRGKSIVLYYFEEDCPSCRSKWPSILSAVQQNQANPVMLIGVNSGSSPAEIARYVKQNRITIPVIVDVDRSFEKLSGVPQVSLKNIWRAKVIGPDGEISVANGGNILGVLSSAAADASWNIDPAGMPKAVLPTWRQIEFGNFAAAAKMLQRQSHDRNPEVKSAAESLLAYVNEKLSTAVSEAETAASGGDAWTAYRTFQDIESRFAGYEVPESVEVELKRLESDDQIKNEISAQRLWQTARRTAASGRAKPARIVALMKKIIEKYPGTQAATDSENAIGGLQ